MIEVDISDEQRGRAEELYRFGALRNSITKGKSNIYGAVGEVVVLDFYRELGRSVILANDMTTTYYLTVIRLMLKQSEPQ